MIDNHTITQLQEIFSIVIIVILKMKEERLQHEIILIFNKLYPNHRFCLFHVDNNSANRVTGARKKALGVVSGVSDLVLLTPHKEVVFIELKTDKGRTTPQQMWFRDNVVSLGYRYEIIRSVDEFLKLLECVWTKKN